ncbi:unnamed protein product [Agarophyton chilense]
MVVAEGALRRAANIQVTLIEVIRENVVKGISQGVRAIQASLKDVPVAPVEASHSSWTAPGLIDITETAGNESDQLYAVEIQAMLRVTELWEATVRFAESGMSFHPIAAVVDLAPQPNEAQPDVNMQVAFPGCGAAILIAVSSGVPPRTGKVGKSLEMGFSRSGGSTPVMKGCRGRGYTSVRGRRSHTLGSTPPMTPSHGRGSKSDRGRERGI